MCESMVNREGWLNARIFQVVRECETGPGRLNGKRRDNGKKKPQRADFPNCNYMHPGRHKSS
jgi:hypothetical protein